LAFFFAAILFSSKLLKFTPALLAERVFNLMYSDTALSCQEESDVGGKKNAITASASGKIQIGEDVFEDQPPSSASQTSGLRRRVG